MLLTILIPTYNRKDDLIFNLSVLDGIIMRNSLQDRVNIIISDNCSTDTTTLSVKKFIENSNVEILYFRQQQNFGLERNVLSALSYAVSQYIMYLGDDDFLDEKYLTTVYDLLENNKNIKSIISSTQGITPDRELIKNSGKDLNTKSALYKAGFKSCLELSWRAHQMSGLVFERDNLYNAYIARNVNNLYPFIFFASKKILEGDCYLLTLYPVKVTQPDQSKKDWTYKNDGLINDMFNNYKHIRVNAIQRSRLELKILIIHPGRYFMYLKKGKIAFIKAILNIMFGKNTSILTTLAFPFLLFYQILSSLIRKVFR